MMNRIERYCAKHTTQHYNFEKNIYTIDQNNMLPNTYVTMQWIQPSKIREKIVPRKNGISGPFQHETNKLFDPFRAAFNYDKIHPQRDSFESMTLFCFWLTQHNYHRGEGRNRNRNIIRNRNRYRNRNKSKLEIEIIIEIRTI